MRSEKLSNAEDIYNFKEVVHSIASGSTGSGKTQSFVLPMLYTTIDNGESAVVIDGKDGELYKNLSHYAKNHRQIVYDLSEPGSSPATWSPIQEGYNLFRSTKAEDRDRAMEMVTEFTGAICSAEGTRDVFWPLSAGNLLCGVIAALYEIAPSEDYVNLSSVGKMLNSLEMRYAVSNLCKELASMLKPDSPAKSYLQSYACGASDTRASTLTTATQHLYNTCGKSEGLISFLNSNSVQYSDLDYGKPTIIWIILSEASGSTYHSLAGLLVNYIGHELIRAAKNRMNGCLPRRWNVFLEEAGIIKVPILPVLAACGRSRGIRLLIALQDPITQLSALYGPQQAMSILSNMTTHFVFANSSMVTLREYSQLCGNTWDETTCSWQQLITPAELFSMPPGRCLILHRGFKAVVDMPFFYKVVKGGIQVIHLRLPRKNESPKVFDLQTYVTEQKRKAMISASAQENRSQGSPLLPTGKPTFGPLNSADIDAMLKDIDQKLAGLDAEEKAQQQKKAKRPLYCVAVISANGNTDKVSDIIASVTGTKKQNVLKALNNTPFEYPFPSKKEAQKAAKEIVAAGGIATVIEHQFEES